MQKGVIKVATEFCAARTRAAAVGERKYVTLNISSPVCSFSPGCPRTMTGGCIITEAQKRDYQTAESGLASNLRVGGLFANLLIILPESSFIVKWLKWQH